MIFCIFNAYGTHYFIIHFHFLKSSGHSSNETNIEKIRKFHKPIIKIKFLPYLWQTIYAHYRIYLRYYSLYILFLSYSIVDLFSYISYTNFFSNPLVIFIQPSFHKADFSSNIHVVMFLYIWIVVIHFCSSYYSVKSQYNTLETVYDGVLS